MQRKQIIKNLIVKKRQERMVMLHLKYQNMYQVFSTNLKFTL